MLVVIDPKTATADEKIRAINLLRAVKAVATAGAGTTPSALAWTSAAGATGAEMITVIANTEAGGWSAGAQDTVPTGSFTTSTDTYKMDLYVTNTGCATYPHHKFCMAVGDQYNSTNLFSGNYSTYPNIIWWYGAHTATNLGTSGAFWTSTTEIPSFRQTKNSTFGNNYGHLMPNDGAFMMACTANYIHFVNLNGTAYTAAGLSYGTNGTGAWVVGNGYRDTQVWETGSSFAALSPPVCSFAVDCRTNYNAAGYPAYSWAWMQCINASGTVVTPKVYVNTGYEATINGAYINPVSGSYGSHGGSNSDNYMSIDALRTNGPDSRNLRNTTYNSIALPLFTMSAHAYGGYGTTIPPVYDSTTGALVPPAYPIVFSNACMTTAAPRMTPGGPMKGIYKSLSTYNTGYTMSNYVTLNQTYVVNGENYFPALTGRDAVNSGQDLFLLRKY